VLDVEPSGTVAVDVSLSATVTYWQLAIALDSTRAAGPAGVHVCGAWHAGLSSNRAIGGEEGQRENWN
jgi:hypothetical protein